VKTLNIPRIRLHRQIIGEIIDEILNELGPLWKEIIDGLVCNNVITNFSASVGVYSISFKTERREVKSEGSTYLHKVIPEGDEYEYVLSFDIWKSHDYKGFYCYL